MSLNSRLLVPNTGDVAGAITENPCVLCDELSTLQREREREREREGSVREYECVCACMCVHVCICVHA